MLAMPDRLAALERRLATLEANPAASLRFGSVTGVEGGFARVQLAVPNIAKAQKKIPLPPWRSL